MASRLTQSPELEFDDEEEEKTKDDQIGDLTDPARTVVRCEAAESGREASDDRAGCGELLLIPRLEDGRLAMRPPDGRMAVSDGPISWTAAVRIQRSGAWEECMKGS